MTAHVIKSAKKHYICSVKLSKHSIYGIVKSHKSKKCYTPFISYGNYSCGCENFLYTQRVCSHILALLYDNIKRNRKYFEEIIVGGTEMKLRYIKTSLEGFNDLVGGIPIGTPIGLIGHPEAGKTILTVQLIHELLAKKTDKNALMIDTEGSGDTVVGWNEILNKRFETNIELISAKVINENDKFKLEFTPKKWDDQAIFIFDLRSLKRLLRFFGRGARIKISNNSGKIGIKADSKTWVTEIEEALIYQIVEDYNIKGITLDSVSAPLKIFGTEQENYPARANCANWLMAPLHDISETFKLCTLITLHETLNPTDMYAKPSFAGGNAVAHSLKYVMYMSEKATSHTPHTDNKNRGITVRELWNKRHPTRAPFSQYRYINLKSNGFVDVNME